MMKWKDCTLLFWVIYIIKDLHCSLNRFSTKWVNTFFSFIYLALVERVFSIFSLTLVVTSRFAMSLLPADSSVDGPTSLLVPNSFLIFRSVFFGEYYCLFFFFFLTCRGFYSSFGQPISPTAHLCILEYLL